MLDTSLDQNEQYQETTCTIQSLYPTECQYQCNCHKEYNRFRAIMEEICQLCDSHTYKYQTSSQICNIKTNYNSKSKNKRLLLLSQEISDSSVNNQCGQQIKKDIGEDYQCFVDCDNKQFTFNDPSISITTSIILLSIGGIICLCGAIPPFVIK